MRSRRLPRSQHHARWRLQVACGDDLRKARRSNRVERDRFEASARRDSRVETRQRGYSTSWSERFDLPVMRERPTAVWPEAPGCA
jgi:hypothetical protein